MSSRHSIDYFFPRVDASTARRCRELLDSLLGREAGGFPGAQPITLSRMDLAEMQSQPHEFLVCEKNDGLRCLLVIPAALATAAGPSRPGQDRAAGISAYLVDRRSTVYALPRLLPPPPPPPLLPKPAVGPSFSPSAGHGTDEVQVGGVVLDCELALLRSASKHQGKADGQQQQQQQQHEDEKAEPQLVVFDMLACNGQSQLHLGYETRRARLVFASKDCIMVERQSDWCLHARTLGLPVHLKSAYELDGIKKLSDGVVNDRAQRLCDGLIFMRRDARYTIGADPNLYKWKSLRNVTVDFKVVIPKPPTTTKTLPQHGDDDHNHHVSREDDAMSMANHVVRSRDPFRLQLFAFHGPTGYRYYAPLHLDANERQTMRRRRRPVDGDILECRYDKSQQAWRPALRNDGEFLVRKDKTHANHISVVSRTFRAIEEGIELKDLLEALSSPATAASASSV